MSAPTLWEEGQLSGTRVVRLAVVACLLLVAADLLLFDRLSPLFDVGFVLVCIGAALAVKPGDFFPVGVMPPFMLIGFLAILAATHPGAIAGTSDGFGQAVVSGLAHHSGALFAADVNALLVLAIRHRIISLAADRRDRRDSPYAVNLADQQSQTKRVTSPRPTLVTSAAPEEKSTTVVGSEGVSSPVSRTASSF